MSIPDNILEKLRNNDKKLINLGMSGSPLGDAGAKILAKAIEGNTSLESLELGNSNIGAEGAKALAITLSKTNALKTLYLRGNKIGDEGSQALSNALKQNNCLEHLYLGGNQITIKGVKAFADAFTINSTLETIYLRNNQVGDEGAKILSNALIHNFGLRVLNVANVGLSEEGCKTFIKLLDSNTTLQSIVFEHNGVESQEIIQAFDEHLKYNTSLPVVTSNAVARKILCHCELKFQFEQNKENTNFTTVEQIAQHCALNRSEQYHWSGINFQGNAILCAAFLHRMIFGRYFNNQEVANNLLQIARELYIPMLQRAKEDIANPKTAKPRPEILQAANAIIG